MKSINNLLPILFLIIPFITFSQEDIKQQILGYTDSTEVMIRNGRKLVVDKTIRGDNAGATETINYLKKTIDKEYVIFYPTEELLLALANSNFEQFLFTAANFNNLLEEKTKQIQLDYISGQIHNFLNQEITLIRKDLENSNLNTEDKRFIELYINFYEGQDNYVLNKSIKSFQKTYPDSEYNSFFDLIKNSIAYMGFCSKIKLNTPELFNFVTT